MPDPPAPHHSAALNRMLGLPPVHPGLEPPIPARDLERELRRQQRRRAAAARARSRKAA